MQLQFHKIVESYLVKYGYNYYILKNIPEEFKEKIKSKLGLQ